MPRGPQLTIIYWRDIPAQVNAKPRGRGSEDGAQILLKPRFQKAIDRAAMKAEITGASEYVAEWRSSSSSLEAGLDSAALEAVAAERAAELDAAFPLARLDELVANKGWDPESRSDTADASTADASTNDSQSNDSQSNDSAGASS